VAEYIYRSGPWHVNMEDIVRGHPSVSLPPLSSPTLPFFICISPTPLYYLQGPYLKFNDSHIQSPMTFQMSTHQKSTPFCSFLRSHLNSIRRASDALEHIHVILWHPPLSRGWLLIGGLVLGGLVL
jgi:hypothetical protein